MAKITIECTCGETYTVNEGEWLICPKCHHPPLFMWSAKIKAHRFGGICEWKANM